MKKTFRVIYLPTGREDKEWIDIQAKDKHQLRKEFKSGVIVDIEEL